jgi:serine O-acetyltransferase
LAADPMIGLAARADIVAFTERDPACTSPLDPLLWFKGYHALQTSRVAHWLWLQGRKTLAHFLQSRASALFGVDIHPNARIGKGIFIDHGTGVVIGETAVVEDGVSMLHGVTLGGTGKERGDRHPKVRRGVLLGAGAKVLGNIEIGACAKIAAGSVVLAPVPAGCTAAGVPARIIGCVDVPEPALEMDQTI